MRVKAYLYDTFVSIARLQILLYLYMYEYHIVFFWIKLENYGKCREFSRDILV